MKKASLAIETFEPCDLNDHNDFLLNGNNNVSLASNDYSILAKHSNLSEDNLIKNCIGLGEENLFNYILESFVDKKQIIFETGIGYAYELDSKVYFKRVCAITNGTNSSDATLCYNQPIYQCYPNSINIVRSYIPERYFQTLHFDNSILISTAPYIPSCLPIKQNSIVGRLDNDLTSISLKSKDFINVIVDSICNYSKQLCFKTSKLNANKLAVKQIQLESDSGNNAKAGTLIYDEKTDSVRFYNGHKWRTLKWEEEENQE